MHMRKSFLGLTLALGAMSAAAQVTGSGTSGTVPQFTGGSSIGDSPISIGNGSVQIGTTTPYSYSLSNNSVNYGDFGGGASTGSFKWLHSGTDGGWNSISSAGSSGLVVATDQTNGITFQVSSGAFDPSSLQRANHLFTVLGSGNVGVGTSGPQRLLQVGQTLSQNPSLQIGGSDGDPNSTGSYSLLFGAWRDIEANVASGIVATPVWACCAGYPSSGYAGIRQNSLGFYTFYNPANPTGYTPQMYIDGKTGNIGIGNTAPTAKLEVSGVMKFTAGSGASILFADNTVQSTAWTGVLSGGDYAESVDVTGERNEYLPGDVLVIDAEHPDRFRKASEPYSHMVAGIYSTKPGVTGRRQATVKSPDELPMAMIGIVPTKVSTENGPILPGDLLVASSTTGHAMKGTDREKMTGAIIGKAMGHIEHGQGVIEVLVTLQ